MTATLGIQVVPLDQVQAIASSLKAPGGGDAVNAAGAVVKAGTSTGSTDVGKIAEKVVKNVGVGVVLGQCVLRPC